MANVPWEVHGIRWLPWLLPAICVLTVVTCRKLALYSYGGQSPCDPYLVCDISVYGAYSVEGVIVGPMCWRLWGALLRVEVPPHAALANLEACQYIMRLDDPIETVTENLRRVVSLILDHGSAPADASAEIKPAVFKNMYDIWQRDLQDPAQAPLLREQLTDLRSVVSREQELLKVVESRQGYQEIVFRAGFSIMAAQMVVLFGCRYKLTGRRGFLPPLGLAVFFLLVMAYVPMYHESGWHFPAAVLTFVFLGAGYCWDAATDETDSAAWWRARLGLIASMYGLFFSWFGLQIVGNPCPILEYLAVLAALAYGLTWPHEYPHPAQDSASEGAGIALQPPGPKADRDAASEQANPTQTVL